MPNDLTNLLPIERQEAVTRNYKLRLTTVAIVLSVLLVATTAVLLLPLYVYLTKTASAKEARLAAIESSLAEANDASLSARLNTLTSDTSTLRALGAASSTAYTIRDVLTLPHPGISITTISYSPTNITQAKMILSGTASTRDALHDYELTLTQSNLFTVVSLPVSAFAQDTKINFTLTLTL